MDQEFNQQEQQLISQLRRFGAGITPKKEGLQRTLNVLDDEDVTNYELPRYSFSMMKYTLLGIVLLVVVGVLGLNYFKHGQLNPTTTPNQSQTADIPTQPVTTSNADTTLQQTDQAMQQDLGQVDKDLQELDQTSNSESDANNI